MSDLDLSQPVKEMKLSYTITRADGTVEKPVEAAYYSQNPLKRWFYNTLLRRGTISRERI